MKTLKKNLVLLIIGILFFFNTSLIAQENTEEDQELNELEDTLGQTFYQDKLSFDEELQKEFVVIESETEHEFNPQLTSMGNDNTILGNVYEGLFSCHPVTLQPQYAIASSYKVSRDKKRWTITIRENACFSNGDPITANDVKNSWIKLLGTSGAPYASLLNIIRGAEAFSKGEITEDQVGLNVKDDYTLSIYLNAPANYLPSVLCHTAFSIVNDDPDVFSGAYCITEKSSKKTVLEKNQNYWDKDNVAIEKITFIQSDDLEENTHMFNTGEAQWISGGLFDAEILLDKEAIQVGPQYGVYYYFFRDSSLKPSNKEKSLWDYKEFREALFEVVPWDLLRKGYPVPATTFIYPLAGYPQVDGYEYTDDIEAVTKMNAAREKYGIPADKEISLKMEVPKGALDLLTIVGLKSAFSILGVKLTVVQTPSHLYFDSIAKSDADIFYYNWVGDFADPLTFLELFHGGSSLNVTGWQNDQFDALIEKAAIVLPDERMKYLAQAENILLDNYMVFPISHPLSYNVIDPKEVGGWLPNAFDLHLFKYMYKKQPPMSSATIVMK